MIIKGFVKMSTGEKAYIQKRMKQLKSSKIDCYSKSVGIFSSKWSIYVDPEDLKIARSILKKTKPRKTKGKTKSRKKKR